MTEPDNADRGVGNDAFDAARELTAHSRRLGICIGTGLGVGAALGNVLDVLPFGVLGGVALGFVAAILWDRRTRSTAR